MSTARDNARPTRGLRLALFFCLVLSSLMVLLSLVSGVWTVVAFGSQGGAVSSDARLMYVLLTGEGARWLGPLQTLSFGVSTVLSTAVMVGSALCIAGRPPGRQLLRWALPFAALTEIYGSTVNALSLVWQWRPVKEALLLAVELPPGTPPAEAEAVTFVVVGVFVGVALVSFVWAGFRVVLYLGTGIALWRSAS